MTLADTIVEVLKEACARPERATPASVCEALARETERHLDRVRFSAQRYMRHPIALWEGWEVLLIAWEKGQVTPVHDHRGVLGGMAMLSGTLDEERFETPGRRPELYDKRLRPEGDLCDIGPTVLHRLMPVSPRAVSLHVYRPPLRTMGIWDETGMISIMPSAFDVDEEILARVDSPRAESIGKR